MENVIGALLNRHHQVTCITSSKWSGTMPENYTEVLIDQPFDLNSVLTQAQVFQARDLSIFTNFVRQAKKRKMISEHCLNNSNVQKFIHRNDLSFDLVINEEIGIDSWLMFAHKFNAPIVTICKCSNSIPSVHPFGRFGKNSEKSKKFNQNLFFEN